MGSFSTMTANLNLNIQNFAENMRRAAVLTNRFSKDMEGKLNTGLENEAKKSKFEFKDVARIVQGILISKAFYGGLNAIRRCTAAVWEFAQELEYAKIAYTNLFGDTALAEEFINVLKDFAATTPFSFKESEAAAKRLLAYGIQYKNVMYVMQGVLSASSIQNNPQAIESISRALGQIYTKGRLMNEEMRQLAEAGIPAYEILQKKLGLTQAQLQNLGREGIPASKAINALVDGMNERFGNVVAASSKTMRGIISNIKDNATMIASGVTQPFTTLIKSGLNGLGEFLFKVREVLELKGLGGVLEYLFPRDTVNTIRQLVGNIGILNQAILRLIAAVAGALKPAFSSVLRLFNAFAPIVVTIANVLATLLSMITSNATAMKILTAAITAAAAAWVVFKVKGIATTVVAGAVNLIAKALAGLSTMLYLIAAHPVWTILLTAIGLVVGLSGGFGKLSDAINGFFKKVTAINGINPDKLLLPSQKERANDLGKFNKALDGTKDSMDDLADSTGKATKAAKGLLSFDEVFKLNQPDEGTDKGIVPDTEFEIPDLSGIGGEAFIPEIPDFSLFSENFVTKLTKSLKERLVGAGIGGIIGGVFGGILGGPLGAKIGAIAGTLAGWFWKDVADKLKLTDVGRIALPISVVLGAAIGTLAGGPLGGVIGAAIGGLVGWLVDAFTKGFKEGDWSAVSMPIGIGLGAAIGAIAGGPVGAVIGAAVGGLIGWIVKKFVNGNWDFKDLTMPIGIGIGAAIGGVVGGPVGIVVGGAIGGLVGWIVKKLASEWDNISAWFAKTWSNLKTWCGNFKNAAVEGFGNMRDTIAEKSKSAWESTSVWFGNMKDTISEKVKGMRSSVSSGFSDIRQSIASRTKSIKTDLVKWTSSLWSNTFGKLFGWIGKGISKFKEFIGLGNKTKKFDFSKVGTGVTLSVAAGTRTGHATGGIFNREHIARFAEGNKAEAVIPLENAGAMQPFVDAVANGITSSLLPIVSRLSGGKTEQLQPLYVGTLIADERSLKELQRKMHVIQIQEENRRGI